MGNADKWIDEDLLRQEIAPILTRHTIAAGDDPEKWAMICETLASLLGNAVAQGCRGDQKMMGIMLDGLCQHVVEVAAERQPIMALLGQFRKG